MNYFIALLFCCTVSFISCAQGPINLNQSQYQADFIELKEALQQHSQPFAFQTEDEFNQYFETAYQSINDTTSMSVFYWKCRALAASVGCGHTRVSYGEQSLAIADSLKFPLDVEVFDNRLFVDNPKENEFQIKQRNEITYINGIATSDLIQSIRQHISADGYNASFQDFWMNHQIESHIAYELGIPEHYTIEYEDDSIKNKVTLKPSYISNSSFNIPSTFNNKIEFKMDSTLNAGILTIRMFTFYQELERYQLFIDKAFKVMDAQQIPNLVIDLRGNLGGDPESAAYLIRYLANMPFTYFDSSTSTYPDLIQPIEPHTHRFRGARYILIDGGGFSTTGHFCSVVKQHGFATFVGTELGSTYTCNDNSKRFLLKNSKLEAKIAQHTFRTTANTFDPKEGILPDISVDLNSITLVSDEDIWMKTIQQILKK